MVARTGHTVEDAVFWYNVASKGACASPHEMVLGVKPKLPGVRNQRERVQLLDDHAEEEVDKEMDCATNPYVVGDKVYLRGSGRCMEAWTGPHRVTKLWSPVAVELDMDGIKRHVSHVRIVPSSRTPVGAQEDDSEVVVTQQPRGHGEDEHPDVDVRRSVRTRRLPTYLQDYDVSGGVVQPATSGNNGRPIESGGLGEV